MDETGYFYSLYIYGAFGPTRIFFDEGKPIETLERAKELALEKRAWDVNPKKRVDTAWGEMKVYKE